METKRAARQRPGKRPVEVDTELFKIEAIDLHCVLAHSALTTPGADARQQARAYQVGDAWIEISGAPPEKRVARARSLGMRFTALEEDMETVFAVLEQERVAKIVFRVLPTQQSDVVAEWLVRKGLKRGVSMMQWIASLEAEQALATDYTIQRIDGEHCAAFARIVVENYKIEASQENLEFYARLPESPGFTCLMAFDGDTPVATGAIYRQEQGCILEYGTTVKSYRNRGLQNAMIAYRLNAARSMGCAWACASTIGNDRSSRNLQRQGFQKAYEELVFRRAGV